MSVSSALAAGLRTLRGRYRRHVKPPAPVWNALRDVAYAEPEPAGNLGHLLDLYLPREPADGPLPLVIWSHGSAFRQENGRLQAELVAAALVPRGYAVAGVAVRSSRAAIFPAQLHDAKAAVRHLRAHASEHGLDPDRFAFLGESSGGWAASMTGLTAGRPELEGEVGLTGVSSAVQAVLPFYPPTDFSTMDAQAGRGLDHDAPGSPESELLGKQITLCPELVRDASPAHYAAEVEDPPPFLIVHGMLDENVPYGQGRQLFDALASGGHPVTLVTVPRGPHGHWLQWLTDPAATPGATSETVRPEAADPSEPSEISLGWDLVAGFLGDALRVPASR